LDAEADAREDEFEGGLRGEEEPPGGEALREGHEGPPQVLDDETRLLPETEREFFIDNLLVQVIEMILVDRLCAVGF
jgi:hypothetical protein